MRSFDTFNKLLIQRKQQWLNCLFSSQELGWMCMVDQKETQGHFILWEPGLGVRDTEFCTGLFWVTTAGWMLLVPVLLCKTKVWNWGCPFNHEKRGDCGLSVFLSSGWKRRFLVVFLFLFYYSKKPGNASLEKWPLVPNEPCHDVARRPCLEDGITWS